MNSPQGAPQKRSSSMAMLAVIGIGVLSLLCCFGTVAAIAIPNFVRAAPRPRQSEAKSNLKFAYTAERAYFSEKDDYPADFGTVGFIPERGNRYLYLVDKHGGIWVPGDPALPHGLIAPDAAKHAGLAPPAAYLAAIPPALLAEAGVHGMCPSDCSVTVIAVGNIDEDADLDVWSVSTQSRTIGGVVVPAGQPFNHVDDLK